MKILYFGDIVGRAGRDAILTHLPPLRDAINPDFIVVNGENAAHGFGISKGICKDLYDNGVDVITMGNHTWDQKEIFKFIEQDKRLIRPINYPPGTPGRGFTIMPAKNGKEVLVVNLMGRLFMDPLDDPFAAIDTLLRSYPMGGSIASVIVDIHAEATSEKMAMGHYCDGRVSLVVGTHTHVPTADAHILEGGTAYQTDAGMCGDYNSVIGMDKQVPLERFTKKFSKERMIPATGTGTLCGLYMETDDKTGLATHIEPIRMGGYLQECSPLTAEKPMEIY